MNIEKGKISNRQLLFLIAGLIHGSILTTSYTSAITEHDSWILILSGFIGIVPFALIYTSLAKSFPNMNLIQINDTIYGRYLGKVISILYIYYFLMVLSFNIRILGDFYVTFFMPETPIIFFIVVFTSVCALSIYKGIEVLGRISHLFVIISFFVIIFTSLLLIKNMNFSNFLPVFKMSFKTFIQGTHIIMAIPLGEVFIFLTIMSSLNSTKNTTRNALIGLTLGAIGLLLITIRNTATLGNTESILTSPSFQAIRVIDIQNIFTRMDILIGIGLTIMIFLKTSLFYYASITSLAQFLNLKSYFPLILPIGGIEVILASINWDSSAVYAKLSLSVAPIFITPYLFILPPLSLLIAKIRNLPKKGLNKGK